ncbi:MAG: translocation/assembly module TamB domain-containing protein [Candidatus Krumholzibacteria bacterium]|nr:translocation/assembly module TamB domain-containing protein [Candidatus Krumholzibacteria bacterium]
MVGLFRNRNRSKQESVRLSGWRKWRRILVRVLLGALLGFIGLLVVVAAAFLFAPTRGALLGWGVRIADDVMPGHITVARADWPSLGHLVLEDVLWVSGSATAPGDTLADVAELDLILDLEALKVKDARVESVRVNVRSVDIPAIAIATAAAKKDTIADALTDSVSSGSETAEIPYLRPGSLPGLPSAALSQFELEVARIRMTPDMAMRDLVFQGNFEGRYDQQAGIGIHHIGARFLISVEDTVGSLVWEVTLDHLGLGLTLEALTDEAGGSSLITASLDSLNLEIAPTADPAMKGIWRTTGPVKLESRAHIDKSGGEYSGRLDCSFLLPGSAQFQSWLPEDFPYDEFGSLSGTLGLTGSYATPHAKGSVRLDLGSNSWMERGLVVAGAEVDVDAYFKQGIKQLSARLDTLDFALLGVSLEAAGHLAPEGIGLDLKIDLDSSEISELYARDMLSDAAIDLQAIAGVSGTLADPIVDARLGGGIRMAGYSVPTFDFLLQGDRRQVEAVLRAGGGIDLEGTALDSVRAEVRGMMAGTDSLSADFALAVWEEDYYLAVGGAVRGDSLRAIRLDSLVVRGLDQEMRTREPATLTLGPGPRDIELTALDIEGGLGSIVAEGLWNDQTMDLAGDIDLLLVESFLQRLLPSPVWSMNGGVDLKLDVSADLGGTDSKPEVAGHAGVRLLPHREDPPFGADLDFTLSQGDSAGIRAEMALVSADTVLLRAQVVWPGNLNLAAGTWEPDPRQDLALTVPAQQLDMERINRRLPAEMAFDGEFEIAAEVRITSPGKGTGMVDSTAVVPLRGSVEGSLGTPLLRIDMPNRSWLETIVGLTVTGSLADPKLGGKIEITEGFIRIPEIPRNLHPIEGESMLWALQDSLVAAMDSSATDSVSTARADQDSLMIFLAPEQLGPALDPPGNTVLPDLDIEVVIDDDLRIIGYGMDIKLGGSMVIGRGFDEDNVPGPSIKGEIKIPEGTLKVMNRVFDVERGNIKFTESVPANPSFDLMLETQAGAYLVRILVSGQAADPVIELTSEPDLSEEDIMAVLLFGQPMNDLDNDQRGRMQEENDPAKELQKNLAGLAMAFGTKGLQDSMSDSFGVDMVQMGSDSSGDSTLMVGKFITPDIVLKYNQSLEKSGTYFMNLEYSLNRYFKVISTYGQGEEASGAELRWSKRY